MKFLKTFENYTTILGRTEMVKISNDNGDFITKEAKIDTGSYSSRISAEIAKELQLKVIDQKNIKSSLGEEDRIFVELQFNINGIEIKTTAGISDMSGLRNEVSIGRKDIELLDGLVDVKKTDSNENPVENNIIEDPNIEDPTIEDPIIDSIIDIDYHIDLDPKNEALINGESNGKKILDLRGPDGNAYVILGIAKNLCNQLKDVNPEKYNWDVIKKEMTSSDYKNLVLTFDKYFGDYYDIYNADVINESVFDKILHRFNYDEKQFNNDINMILKSLENNDDLYTVYKINDELLKIYGKDRTIRELYLKPEKTSNKDEYYFIFNPKSGGAIPFKLSKEVVNKSFNDLLKFAKEDPVKTKSKVKVEDNYDLERFYKTVEKLYNLGQKTRKKQIVNIFFRNFIGKELLNSTIKEFNADFNIEDNFYAITIFLNNGTTIYYNFKDHVETDKTDHITINPKINKSGLSRDEKILAEKELSKVSRKDAHLIGLITKKINPNTSYFKGTGDLIIKEYESKNNKNLGNKL